MEKAFNIMIEHPDTPILDRKCKWICPEFHAVDGFAEQELWTLKGLIVAIGFIDDEKQKIIGSGVMIAPGVCLTATHVMEDMREKNALLYSFPCENSMRVWAPRDFHAPHKISIKIMPFQKVRPRFMDVGVLSYSPLSKFIDKEDFVFAPLEVAVPKIGERLWATGYREIGNDGVPTISFFCSSGIVTEQYLEGRGSHINGPCIEVAMETRGGMSGGPVFNAEGRVIGVISSSLDGPKGPTYVSLIWASLLSTVYAPWPENHWPENIAGIQTLSTDGVRLEGSARIDDEGSYKVKFPIQSSESMLSILKTAGIKFPGEDYDFIDFAYENFEEFLEKEGLKYLSTVDKLTFDNALIDTEYTEILKLFNCVDAITLDGLEDLHIESVKLLDDGNIGIDARFNIRNSILRLKIPNQDYEYHKDLLNSLDSLVNYEVGGDYVYCEHYARPFYRVNFTYNIVTEDCKDIRFQVLSLKI